MARWVWAQNGLCIDRAQGDDLNPGKLDWHALFLRPGLYGYKPTRAAPPSTVMPPDNKPPCHCDQQAGTCLFILCLTVCPQLLNLRLNPVVRQCCGYHQLASLNKPLAGLFRACLTTLAQLSFLNFGQRFTIYAKSGGRACLQTFNADFYAADLAISIFAQIQAQHGLINFFDEFALSVTSA